MYSGTSNKDPLRKGQPLYKGNLSTKDTSNIPKSVYATHFQLPKRGQPPLQGTKWLVPKCPFLGGSTVYYNYIVVYMYAIVFLTVT